MPRPVAGSTYVIVKGDTLSGIASSAYGNGRRWREIWRANEAVLKSGDPNLIYSIGEVIQIPKISELEQQGQGKDLPNKESDDFTLIIDGREIPVESGRLLRSVDTGADGWSATIFYDIDNLDLVNLLSPYKYNEAIVYLGGIRQLTGWIYSVSIEISGNGVRKTLSGASKTIDLVDSTMRAPYEFRKTNLENIAKTVAKPYQIDVIFESPAGGIFSRATAEKEETIFSFLSKLSSQRSLLVTNNVDGNLVFTKAGTENVGSLIVGLPPLSSITVEFDGRKRFSVYKAIGPRRSRSKKAISKDSVVKLSRFKTFNAEDSTAGDIQKIADWERSKQVAESLTFDIPVDTWYGPDNKLWAVNTILTVQSKELYIPDGFDFLIKSVEFEFSNDGTPAKLGLVPPQVYTGEPIEEPWLR